MKRCFGIALLLVVLGSSLGCGSNNEAKAPATFAPPPEGGDLPGTGAGAQEERQPK